MIQFAQLGGQNLPVNFSYVVRARKKRIAVRNTFAGAVVQRSNPSVVISDKDVIVFNFLGSASDWNLMKSLYNMTGLLLFSGYWGEQYQVIFTELDDPSVSGRIFRISGKLQIMCIISEDNPNC